MKSEIMDLKLDEALPLAQLKMDMLEMVDLQHSLMYEQIVLPLEDINQVIKEVVLLNVEMEENMYRKRNATMKILTIMMVEVPHA